MFPISLAHAAHNVDRKFSTYPVLVESVDRRGVYHGLVGAFVRTRADGYCRIVFDHPSFPPLAYPLPKNLRLRTTRYIPFSPWEYRQRHLAAGTVYRGARE